MTSIHNQQYVHSETTLETLVSDVTRLVEQNKTNVDLQAILATTSKSLEEILTTIDSEEKVSSEKVVNINFRNSPSLKQKSDPQVVTNAKVEQIIAQLMGLLAELEAQLAKWGNTKAQWMADSGQTLATLLNNIWNTLDKACKQAEKAADNIWTKLEKAAGYTLAVLTIVVSVLTGNFVLAAITLVMLILSATGTMDKATQALAGDLEKAGLSPEVAKVVASVIITVIVIIVTIACVGSGALLAEKLGQVTEEAATEGEQALQNASNIGGGGAPAPGGGGGAPAPGGGGAQAQAPGEGGAQGNSGNAPANEGPAEEGPQPAEQNASQGNFLSRATEWVKSHNPFRFLPKSVNMGIVAGSMAVGETNLGQYLAQAILVHMKDGKTKEALTMLIETIVNTCAALAGLGAAGATSTNNSFSLFQLRNTSLLLKGLMVGETVAGLTDAAGQIGTSNALANQAEIAVKTGDTEAAFNVTEALIKTQNNQSKSDTKALSDLLRAKAEGLEALNADLPKAIIALAEVLG